jgi:alpha/beta hydrolase family protein
MDASLNVHDGRGQPVPLPENLRMYFAASHSHVGASGVAARPTAAGTCAYPTNGNLSYNALLRALVVALDEWADRGVAPPPNRYPSLAARTLVRIDEAASMFPRIPGVRFPAVLNEVSVLDYGAKFGPAGGWLSRLPPVRGAQYQSFVPKPDVDGLDLGGIRTLDIAAPVGTNTGWNLRAAGPRGNDLCGLSGSFFPFATTKTERLASGDPRLSLEERYQDHAGFVAAVERAARGLVKDRFLLEEDAKTLIETARASDILH